MTCPSILVTSADYAECNGAYSVTDYVVLWAVDRPVYKHVAKDRYVGGVWMERVICVILYGIFSGTRGALVGLLEKRLTSCQAAIGTEVRMRQGCLSLFTIGCPYQVVLTLPSLGRGTLRKGCRCSAR